MIAAAMLVNSACCALIYLFLSVVLLLTVALLFDIFVFIPVQAIHSPKDAQVLRQATSAIWCKTHVDPVRSQRDAAA